MQSNNFPKKRGRKIKIEDGQVVIKTDKKTREIVESFDGTNPTPDASSIKKEPRGRPRNFNDQLAFIFFVKQMHLDIFNQWTSMTIEEKQKFWVKYKSDVQLVDDSTLPTVQETDDDMTDVESPTIL